MCGSTCFGRLPAHHQEHTTALGASGFTVGEKRLERCVLWSTDHNTQRYSRPFQRQKQRLLVQLYAPDDAWGDARNMLTHIWTSSNRLVKTVTSFRLIYLNRKMMHGLANVKFRYVTSGIMVQYFQNTDICQNTRYHISEDGSLNFIVITSYSPLDFWLN